MSQRSSFSAPVNTLVEETNGHRGRQSGASSTANPFPSWAEERYPKPSFNSVESLPSRRPSISPLKSCLKASKRATAGMGTDSLTVDTESTYTTASADEAKDRVRPPPVSDIQSTGTVVRFAEDTSVLCQLEKNRAENKEEREKPLLQVLDEEQAARKARRERRAQRRAASVAKSHEGSGNAAEQGHDMPSSVDSIDPVSQ